MSMMRLQETAAPTPYHDMICDNCGGRLGRHWLFRPDKRGDISAPTRFEGRKADGKLYCHRDQLGCASSYHQRALRRSMEPLGYKT